jgi:hypothetical protein
VDPRFQLGGSGMEIWGMRMRRRNLGKVKRAEGLRDVIYVGGCKHRRRWTIC